MATPSGTRGESVSATAAITTVQQRDETGTIAYHWKHEKCYSEFPEVAFIEAFMGHLDDVDRNGYLFIRVGESGDYIEHRGGFWENPLNMCLIRQNAFDD